MYRKLIISIRFRSQNISFLRDDFYKKNMINLR